MAAQKSMGPFCQSCGMPLVKPDDFGTTKGGVRVNDYCRYCYQDGAFTNATITMDEMATIGVGALVRQGMPEASARALMTDTLPTLKRWRRPSPIGV